MAAQTAVVFFGIWFRQRACSVCAGYLRYFGGVTFGVRIDFDGCGRPVVGFFMYGAVYVGHTHLRVCGEGNRGIRSWRYCLG